MQRALASVLMLLAVLCLAAPARARADDETRTEIHLVVMGPGDELFTRAGHLSLMVAQNTDGRITATRVYNYGDTDWSNRWIVPQFLAGTLDFQLSSSGTLQQTAELYGLKQRRDVWRQRLQLSDEQAATIAARLEHELEPENRRYRYHHLEAICTTRVRDLLDEVSGGVIQRQLAGQPLPRTVQDDVLWAFSHHPFAAIAADLFFGRRHYRPIDQYDALYEPARMGRALQRVMVPHPSDGSRLVPLAREPVAIGKRGGPPVITAPSRASTWFAAVVLALLIALGIDAYRQLPRDPRVAGTWLLAWALPFGLLGTLIAALMVFSGVPELHDNELVASFPASDLLLIGTARRWRRGERSVSTLARRYALARALLVGLSLVALATGVFIQRPIALPLLSAAFSLGLLLLLRRIRSGSAS
jgi:hypothetical protein